MEYHDTSADFSCVPHFFEETGMLFDSWDSKGRVLCSDADDKVIKWNLSFVYIAFKFTRIRDGERFICRINAGAIRFKESDGSLLVAKDMSNRLHNGPRLNEPCCRRR
jgi:hypothetical protein